MGGGGADDANLFLRCRRKKNVMPAKMARKAIAHPAAMPPIAPGESFDFDEVDVGVAVGVRSATVAV